MQSDNRSYAATALLPLMTALARGLTADPASAAMLDDLAHWDGSMSRDATEPLLFMAWIRELSRLLYGDELGAAFGRLPDIRPDAVMRMLTERQAWCDDIGTPERENCATISARALDAAIALLRERLGENTDTWRWGSLHKVAFRHPVVGRIPVLRDLFGTVIETDGGPFTINRGTARLSGGPELFGHVHGPGLRAVFDLANLGASHFMIASGQSGHPLSPFYIDTTQPWRDGETFFLAGDATALRQDAVGVMRLIP